MPLQPGTRLGPYELVAPLGAGAMGEVWRATDARLERSVAVKVLPEEFAGNPQLKIRFEREAKLISQLNHPNICVLHDVGEAAVDWPAGTTGDPAEPPSAAVTRSSALHYLVMELLEGETLADRLRRGPLPLAEVLRYGIEIAEALHRAHRAGVVHRDLKPANIMLTKSGAKLLDFGLAKGVEVGLSADDATVQRQLTQEGTILGTFQYMAPEQLEALEADARTDLFALGAVLYEMVTGRRAFDGKTKTSLIAAIVAGEPRPISSLQPVSPPALEHVVMRCLEKDPDHRWQSASDVAAELRWIRDAGVAVARAADRRITPARERVAWSLVVVLLAVSAVAGWMAVTGDRAPAYELAVTPPTGGELLLGSNLGWGVLSPDGRYVVFPAATPDGRGLWVRPIGRDQALLLPGTQSAFYPFWSPDSRWIGFFERGAMKKVEVSGGLPAVITTVAVWGRGGSWGEDGWIYFCPIGGGNIMRVRAEGGEATDVTVLDASRGDNAHYWPVILPGGKQLLYFVRSGRREQEGVWLARLDGDGKAAEKRRLIGSSSNAIFAPARRGRPAWLLWAEEGKLLARPFDPVKGEVTGSISHLGISVSVMEAQRALYASVSRDGALAVVPERRRPEHFAWFSRDGRPLGEQPMGTPGHYYTPRFSPDGKMISFVSVREGAGQIWILDVDQQISWPVTSGTAYSESSVWSPDGTEIVYQSTDATLDQIIRRNVRGTADGTTLFSAPVSEGFDPYGWSSGGFVIGRLQKGGRAIIGAIPLAAPGTVIPLSGDGATEVMAVSPNGAWLAYSTASGGRVDSYIAPLQADGTAVVLGPPQRLPLDDPIALLWSRHGNELLAHSRDGGVHALPITIEGDVLRFGSSRNLFRQLAGSGGDIAVTPDGERLIFKVDPEAPGATIRLFSNWQSRVP